MTLGLGFLYMNFVHSIQYNLLVPAGLWEGCMSVLSGKKQKEAQMTGLHFRAESQNVNSDEATPKEELEEASRRVRRDHSLEQIPRGQ